MQDIIASDPAIHHKRQAGAAVFVYQGKDLDRFAVTGPIHHKIIGPNMVAMARTQPDTRPVIEPQPPSFGLFLRNFQPLLTPDALDTLVVHTPSGIT